MKMLIVEDEEFKRERLIGCLTDNFSVELSFANSVFSAKLAVSSQRFDLILLDMSLPTYDIASGEAGGRAQNYGGREVLRYIRRKKIEADVIVVTMFEAFGEGGEFRESSDLSKMLFDQYPEVFHGIVYFDSNGDWEDKLTSKVTELTVDEN